MRAGHPHPKRKLVRRLLINGMCNFEDEIKTAVRDYIADFFNAHLFKAFLYNYSALSQTEHEPQGGEPLLKLRGGSVNRPVVIQSIAWESPK